VNTEHPITPPPELVEQWMQAHSTKYDLARQAAQWGADMELEACCRWLPKLPPWSANDLRKHRRPKPPSLKEQALEALRDSPVDPVDETLQLSADAELIIRRALEALDD
jgi:hypothetical protein